jgi:hypothetical protein
MMRILHAISSVRYHTGVISIVGILLFSDTVTVNHENYTYA